MGKHNKNFNQYDDCEEEFSTKNFKEKEKTHPIELDYMSEIEYKKLKNKNRREKNLEKNQEKRNRKKIKKEYD